MLYTKFQASEESSSEEDFEYFCASNPEHSGAGPF